MTSPSGESFPFVMCSSVRGVHGGVRSVGQKFVTSSAWGAHQKPKYLRWDRQQSRSLIPKRYGDIYGQYSPHSGFISAPSNPAIASAAQVPTWLTPAIRKRRTDRYPAVAERE